MKDSFLSFHRISALKTDFIVYTLACYFLFCRHLRWRGIFFLYFPDRICWIFRHRTLHFFLSLASSYETIERIIVFLCSWLELSIKFGSCYKIIKRTCKFCFLLSLHFFGQLKMMRLNLTHQVASIRTRARVDAMLRAECQCKFVLLESSRDLIRNTHYPLATGNLFTSGMSIFS